MQAILNIDKNWGIGADGDQPFFISEDLQFFKEKTLGKVVVMGRATLQALPKGQPLKGRTNVVLTRQKGFDAQGSIVCNDFDELSETLKTYPAEEVFIIGGAEIYETLLPYCSKVYITKIDAEADCDRFFPNLDQMPNWRKKSISEVKRCEETNLEFRFWEYENGSPLPFYT